MQRVRPYSEPDWDGWIYMPEVSRVEAVCLSMNICPQHAQEDYGILDAMRGEDEEGFGPRLPDQDAAAVFRRRMFISRHLGNRVKLTDFVQFADQVGWEMPAELVSIVRPPATVLIVDTQPSVPSSNTEEHGTLISPSKTENAPVFPNIDDERRTHLDTACAAYWLGRKEQTLRAWASSESGPIRPVRLHRRLAWPVAEIRHLLKK